MINNNYTINDAKNWAYNQLINTNNLNYKNEIKWFLCDVLECNDVFLSLHKNTVMTQSQNRLFSDYILERKSGKPFQYILGYSTFYGRDFIVNSDVLIPRPESEIIIENIIKYSALDSMLEVGAGSGCIGITASLEIEIDNVTLTDISEPTLRVAKKNGEKHNVRNINFVKHDFINDRMFDEKFDLIISNPPYINKKEYTNLSESVKNYEPKKALTDSMDGLSFYRTFAENGLKLMHKNSIMILEFGGNKQLLEIKNIFSNYNYKIDYDLQGDARIIILKL